jgi:hypothetical protein
MTEARVLAHWSHFLDGTSHSSQVFYEELEKALDDRKIPGARVSRFFTAQGGFLGGMREYVRIERNRFTFDICAGPFGKGFFVSWWFSRASRVLVALISLFVAAVTIGALVYRFGLFGAGAGLVAVPLLFLLIGAAASRGVLPIEDELIATPVIGWLYDFCFRPVTYYSQDTAEMFRAAVHVAVLDVVDGITNATGSRALTELERKPLLRAMSRGS